MVRGKSTGVLMQYNMTHNQPEVGERHQNNKGDWYTIIGVNGCKDITIQFDERGFIKKTESIFIRTGSIRLPKYFVGDEFFDKKGNKAKIVNIESSSRYTFEWEDGYQRICQSSVISLGTLLREEDSCQINPEIKVGQFFTNTQGVTLEVIKYEKASKVTVKVHGPVEYEIITTQGNLKKGVVHDKYSPSFAGKGILGDAVVDVKSQEYVAWAGMIKRCYIFYENKPTARVNYEGCEVADHFLYYPNFTGWFGKQFVQPKWQLDKDLLVKGNKIYSAETCVFLPRALNTFLTLRGNHRGPYPIGVTIHEETGHFEAACNRDGKRIYLGVYKTPEAAFEIYKAEKEAYAKDLAARWKGQIDPRAYDALMNWTVDITD
jgi:hypothetical protein